MLGINSKFSKYLFSNIFSTFFQLVARKAMQMFYSAGWGNKLVKNITCVNIALTCLTLLTVSQIFGFYFQRFPYFGERIEKHNSCTSLISTQSIILHGTIKCLAIDYRVCSTDIYCIDFAYFPLQPLKILLIFSLNKQIGIPPNVRFE